MEYGPLPELDTVTVCAADVVPAGTLPKFRLDGEAEGLPMTPCPWTVTDWTPTFVVMERVVEAGVGAVGRNST